MLEVRLAKKERGVLFLLFDSEMERLRCDEMKDGVLIGNSRTYRRLC